MALVLDHCKEADFAIKQGVPEHIKVTVVYCVVALYLKNSACNS